VNKSKQESELVSAAEALDQGFRRFEQLTEGIQRVPLNSQKNLLRASEMLTEIAGLGEALQRQLGSVVAAIAKFRQKQEGQADRVQKQAEQVQERSRALQGLLEQYRTLGESARQLNLGLQKLSTAAVDGSGAISLLAGLQELEPGVEELMQGASSLAERASVLGFADMAHQADSLRQQLQAVRNKVNLLRQNTPQA
jgi:methyl-accepting chemotaxis protein